MIKKLYKKMVCIQSIQNKQHRVGEIDKNFYH